MAVLSFDHTQRRVSDGGSTVELLAKEYALLQCLYRHRGQALSREQLLDLVWGLESPVDRTVDDHVYRLRRKLKGIGSIQIYTIRGYGYSLAVDQPEQISVPSWKDQEMQDAVQQMLRKYHLFGQGHSLSMLAAQQQVLGVEIDPYYLMYIHFLDADALWFLEQTQLPPEERMYWMLLIYAATAPATAEGLAMGERALADRRLFPEQHRELRILNILDFYIEYGRLEGLPERLKEAYEVVQTEQLDGFRMPVALVEMSLYLAQGDLVRVAAVAERLEQQLQDAPYLRELAGYRVNQGLWRLLEGREAEAEALLQEGMGIFEMARQSLLQIKAVCRIQSFIRRYAPHERLEKVYAEHYQMLDAKYNITEQRPRLEQWLRTHLRMG